MIGLLKTDNHIEPELKWNYKKKSLLETELKEQL